MHSVRWCEEKSKGLQNVWHLFLGASAFFPHFAHMDLLSLQMCWWDSQSCFSKKWLFLCCDMHVVVGWYVVNCLDLLGKRKIVLLHKIVLIASCRHQLIAPLDQMQKNKNFWLQLVVLMKHGWPDSNKLFSTLSSFIVSSIKPNITQSIFHSSSAIQTAYCLRERQRK